MAGRWHYGAPKGLLGRLLQLTGGGFTVRRDGPAIPDHARPDARGTERTDGTERSSGPDGREERPPPSQARGYLDG